MSSSPLRVAALILSALLLLLASRALSQLPADADGAAILRALHDRDAGDRLRAEVRMTLTDGRGARRVRELELVMARFDGGLRTRMRFRHPADVAGTALLTIDHDEGEDEQWLHLPALGRTARIRGGGRARSFLGSDLSFADLSRREPGEWIAEVRDRDATVDGTPAWHLALRPRDAEVREATGYARAELWVAKESLLVLRSKGWMEGGHVKYVMAEDVARVDGVWVARRLVARTVRAGEVESETVLERRALRFDDPSVTEGLVVPAAL